jgi:endonuclease-3
VDTHCWRICRRLGWVRSRSRDGVCSKQDMDRLQEMIPAELRYSLHVNLISLGREFCRSGNPRCPECPLASVCKTSSRRGRKPDV